MPHTWRLRPLAARLGPGLSTAVSAANPQDDRNWPECSTDGHRLGGRKPACRRRGKRRVKAGARPDNCDGGAACRAGPGANRKPRSRALQERLGDEEAEPKAAVLAAPF